MTTYKIEQYSYFDFLVIINHLYFPTREIGQNVRINSDEIKYIDQKISEFFDQVTDEINLDFVIEKLLNLVGLIWLLQPFYDGNTRSLITFMKFFFDNINYNIDLSWSEKDDSIIPLFYYEDEKCQQKDILNLKRRLTKK